MCRTIPWSNSRMDVYITRRNNLAALVNSMFDGNQAKLGAKIGVKQPQVNRWLSTSTASPRKISETSARHIEAKLGLPKGVLDDQRGCSNIVRPTQRKVVDEFFWLMENGDDTAKQTIAFIVDSLMTQAKSKNEKPSVELPATRKGLKKA